MCSLENDLNSSKLMRGYYAMDWLSANTTVLQHSKKFANWQEITSYVNGMRVIRGNGFYSSRTLESTAVKCRRLLIRLVYTDSKRNDECMRYLLCISIFGNGNTSYACPHENQFYLLNLFNERHSSLPYWLFTSHCLVLNLLDRYLFERKASLLRRAW